MWSGRLRAELESFAQEEDLSPLEQALVGRFIGRVESAVSAAPSAGVNLTLPSASPPAAKSLLPWSVREGGVLQRDPPTELVGGRRPAPVASPPNLPDEYQDLGLLGAGGMGEVHKVLDRRLGRLVAMKIVHNHLVQSQSAVDHFIDEARLTSQLQHPGIAPVFDVGRLSDGRPWFTMRLVNGHTCREVLQILYSRTPGDWTLERAIEVFRRACEAVAYAHSRGVTHRDLKPSNIMLGSFGEVLVLDWGLARPALHLKVSDPDRIPTSLSIRVNERPRDEAPPMEDLLTPAGTPTYMAPELLSGVAASPQTDVYALGAILYELLSGRPPYPGEDTDVVRVDVSSGPPPTLSEVLGGRIVPLALQHICERAMSREPEQRQVDAMELVGELGAWLEGARRREEARRVVAEAEPLRERVENLRDQALSLQGAARAELARIPPNEPVVRKKSAWEWDDRASVLGREADLTELKYVQTLHSALSLDPDLPEAHAHLAGFYRERHGAAELDRNPGEAARMEWLLRDHDRAGTHSRYLRGDGVLTLHTDPPEADVLLYRFDQRERRLIPRLIRSLGKTPLDEVELQMGSYLLEIWAPGRSVVRLPVQVPRLGHWIQVRPGDVKAYSNYLPGSDELGPDDVYVPAGWYRSQPDPSALSPLPARQVWVESFVMRRFAVTNQEYLDFLEELVERGEEEKALTLAPQERGGSFGHRGAQIYGRDPDGGFLLRRDADGDTWQPEGPVVMVDWHGARAYAHWLGEEMGLGWRLPWELEWEKAGRGADGRYYPWGDHFDPTWACVMDSRTGVTGPALVDSFPVDESPYGIRGLSGNIREWCEDAAVSGGIPLVEGQVFEPDLHTATSRSPLRVCRGGAWSTHNRAARLASRTLHPMTERAGTIGFRLVRSLNLPPLSGS